MTRPATGTLVPVAGRTPDTPPSAPVVQRLRVRYAKRGRLRFTSTRDFQRALERALRRAGVPMAYSAGFHPHPRISYANAAATGTASEAEYFEIALTRSVDPRAVLASLDEALPDGLDVLEVVVADTASLAEKLQASVWRVELRGARAGDVEDALTQLMAREEVVVSRMMKNGRRWFDVRAAVLSARVEAAGVGPTDDPCAILTLVVRHTTPVVRPDDVLTAMCAVAEFSIPAPPLVTRLAQGPLRPATATVADPLAADHERGGP